MKGIVINKDIEEYEHDAWRGFSVRQIIFGGISVSASAAVILFAYIVCYMPIQAAAYLGIPVGVIIALVGFMQIDDMNLREYLQEIWRLSFSEPLTWQTEEYEAEKALYEKKAKELKSEMDTLEKRIKEEERHMEKTVKSKEDAEQLNKSSGKKTKKDREDNKRNRKLWKDRKNRNSREWRTKKSKRTEEKEI